MRVSSTNSFGKTGHLHIKVLIELDSHLRSYTKINTKRMKDLNVRLDPTRLLEEHGEKASGHQTWQ